MEKVTEATLHLEKVTEAMAKCNLSLEYLKVTEAMAKCNLSLNYSQKIFWSDWTILSKKYCLYWVCDLPWTLNVLLLLLC